MTNTIVDYYSTNFEEDARLSNSYGFIEYYRTQDILSRFLPKSPAIICDVGGGTGVYSCWLLKKGYSVNMMDIVPGHVELAREKMSKIETVQNWSAVLGDALNLELEDNSQDAILLMGPLYHTQDRAKRIQMLREGYRVLKPGGLIFSAVITRFASLIDGLDSSFIYDEVFREIIKKDLESGCHQNPTEKTEYFTDAFFHHPYELEEELIEGGFEDPRLLAIEGLFWAERNLQKLIDDKSAWKSTVKFMQMIESDRSIIGVSPHIMGISSKRN